VYDARTSQERSNLPFASPTPRGGGVHQLVRPLVEVVTREAALLALRLDPRSARCAQQGASSTPHVERGVRADEHAAPEDDAEPTPAHVLGRMRSPHPIEDSDRKREPRELDEHARYDRAPANTWLPGAGVDRYRSPDAFEQHACMDTTPHAGSVPAPITGFMSRRPRATPGSNGVPSRARRRRP
jgi:hypothetical protein